MLKYAKAILAGLIAGVGGIALGYVDDVLTRGELWGAVALGLTALGAVFGVPNAATGDEADPVTAEIEG